MNYFVMKDGSTRPQRLSDVIASKSNGAAPEPIEIPTSREVIEMNTPILPVPPPAPGMTPSSSTTASGVGAMIAAVVIWALNTYLHINFPAGVEAAIAGLITTAAGYLPTSGRK